MVHNSRQLLRKIKETSLKEAKLLVLCSQDSCEKNNFHLNDKKHNLMNLEFKNKIKQKTSSKSIHWQSTCNKRQRTSSFRIWNVWIKKIQTTSYYNMRNVTVCSQSYYVLLRYLFNNKSAALTETWKYLINLRYMEHTNKQWKNIHFPSSGVLHLYVTPTRWHYFLVTTLRIQKHRLYF